MLSRTYRIIVVFWSMLYLLNCILIGFMKVGFSCLIGPLSSLIAPLCSQPSNTIRAPWKRLRLKKLLRLPRMHSAAFRSSVWLLHNCCRIFRGKANTHIYTYTHTHTHTQIQIHTHTHTFVHISDIKSTKRSLQISILHLYTHTNTHTQTQTQTHKHKHKHTQNPANPQMLPQGLVSEMRY